MLNAVSLSEIMQIAMFLLFSVGSIMGWLVVRRVNDIDKKFDALERDWKELMNGKADRASEVALFGRVDMLEDRTTRIEAELRHLPDKEVTHRLEVSIGQLSAEMSVLSERMKPIAAISDRVQEALLQRMQT